MVNEANETVGTIDDLIVTPGGQAPYAVLSVGGFLGMGTKYVVVPFTYSATVRMAGQRQQACPVAACEEDGVTDAARQVWCCTARHVDDAVMTSLCLMSRLLSLVARRFCRAAAER